MLSQHTVQAPPLPPVAPQRPVPRVAGPVPWQRGLLSLRPSASQTSKCSGAQVIAAIRRLAPSKEIERKLLYRNARRVFAV